MEGGRKGGRGDTGREKADPKYTNKSHKQPLFQICYQLSEGEGVLHDKSLSH